MISIKAREKIIERPINIGYGVQQESVAAASKKIWTNGCIEIIRVWAERNLYTIAAIALGI